jgi:hypothetical protein
MKVLKYLAPSLVLAGGLLFNTMTSFARPEYSKKEKVGCAKCHVKVGSKELNGTGKYYQEHKAMPATK